MLRKVVSIRNVAGEMTVLWTVETIVGFLGIYAGLHQGNGEIATGAALWSSGAVGWAIDALVLTALLALPFPILGLYRPAAMHETRVLLVTAGVAALCSVLMVWTVFESGLVHRPMLLGMTISPIEIASYWTALLIGTRMLFIVMAPWALFPRDVVVIGQGARANAAVDAIRKARPGLFRVSLSADIHACKANRSWKVIVTDEDTEAAPTCDPAHLKGLVVDLATFWERQVTQVDLGSLARRADLASAIAAAARSGTKTRIARRSLDIAVAGLLLLITAPLMALTALLVKIESPGPVIYRQERVGLGGQVFTILKFRSMHTDAEHNGVAVWARVRDARVTRVGRFIRNVRIDELPQLFNIIRGDMSLVGPRPERPTLAHELNNEIAFFDMRVLVKPGLTGWAQVNMAYTATAEEARGKLAYDLYYIKHQSLWLDLMILMSTVRVLVFQAGAR